MLNINENYTIYNVINICKLSATELNVVINSSPRGLYSMRSLKAGGGVSISYPLTTSTVNDVFHTIEWIVESVSLDV